MRIMLSASPSIGNTVPVLTLARAALAEGHEVALLTAAELTSLAGPITVLPAGPSWAELAAENLRRHPGGMGDPATGANVSPDQAAEFFAATRLDMGGRDALKIADAWAPDIVVAEASDAFGPFVAAALSRPWCSHGFGVPLPESFAQTLQTAAAGFYRVAGVEATDPVAYVDPWPEILQSDDWPQPARRIPITLEPLPDAGDTWAGQLPTDRYTLVTFGTQVHEADTLRRIVDSVFEHTAGPVVVTRGALTELGFDEPRVTVTDFIGLAALLEGAEAVVTVGGSGTVLAALSRGVPVVINPVFPSQRWVAESLSRHGAAVVIDDPAQAGPAVQRVMHDGAVRQAVETIARYMAEHGSPIDAVRALVARAQSRT